MASLGAKPSNSAGVFGGALEHKRTVVDVWPLRVLSLVLQKQCVYLVCLPGGYFRFSLAVLVLHSYGEGGGRLPRGGGGVADVCPKPE